MFIPYDDDVFKFNDIDPEFNIYVTTDDNIPNYSNSQYKLLR